MTRRLATFTEANAWVHLPPESFTRHFPSIRSVWQAQGGRMWVEVEEPSGMDPHAFAWWELADQRTGEPVLPCGCWVQVRYRPHARETLCMFSNRATGFRTTLRISGRLMLVASAPTRLHEAVCVHPHDEGTVQEQLEQALLEARAHRPARKEWREIRCLLLVLRVSTVLLAQGPVSATAHPGGLDAYGCHHDRKAGGYHCHRGPLAGQDFASQAEMLNALKTTPPKRTGPKTPEQTGEPAETEEKSKDRPR